MLNLNYCLLDKVITDKRVKVVGDIAFACGYDIADVDSDEDEKRDLTELVNKLNMEFL